MNTSFFFLFIACFLASRCFCEKSEFLPIGDIISAVSEVKNAISGDEQNELPNTEAVPKINLKIVPSKKINISKSSMAFLLAELKQEIARQITILSDELEQKERMRQRAASISSINGNAIYIPENEEEEEDNKTFKNEPEEENQEEIAEFINSLNEIADNENLKVTENRTYNIKINNETAPQNESNPESTMSFRQKSFRNGPVVS